MGTCAWVDARAVGGSREPTASRRGKASRLQARRRSLREKQKKQKKRRRFPTAYRRQKKRKGSRGAADVTRIRREARLPSGRDAATHHPRGHERGERDGLLRRRASLRVGIAGRDRGQWVGREARAIRRARKDRTRGSDLTRRSTETPRSTRRTPRARPRTWPVLPMISTLSPLGTALTMPCIHPAPFATMVVVGGSKVCRAGGGCVPFSLQAGFEHFFMPKLLRKLCARAPNF